MKNRARKSLKVIKTYVMIVLTFVRRSSSRGQTCLDRKRALTG